MSELTRRNLDTFWELVDEVLNGILFVLIGLEFLIMPHNIKYILAGFLIIPLVLLARLISVGSSIRFLRLFQNIEPGTIRILTWAGLRGGISIALALSLPAGPEREIIIVVTYVIMAFSILAQGLTVGRVIRRLTS